MTVQGVKTPDLTPVPTLDDVLGNQSGSTVQAPIDSFATQLIGSGPLADRINNLESQITSGLLSASTWAALSGLSGGADGAGAEVLDSDAGTHAAASATGYDGAAVPNAGRYSWNAAWGRWVRIGDSGLADKANLADLATVALSGDSDDLTEGTINLLLSEAERAKLGALRPDGQVWKLNGVAGTADAYTASRSAEHLTAAWGVGQIVLWKAPAGPNTGAVTIAIDGQAAVPVVRSDLAQMQPGDIDINDWQTAVVQAVSGSLPTQFRMVSSTRDQALSQADRTKLTNIEAGATILRSTWSSLQQVTWAENGQLAEVDDADIGTHLDLTASGYDGASVPNAGIYSWSASWNGWLRTGDTGLAGKVAYADGIAREGAEADFVPAEFDGNGIALRWWDGSGDMHVAKGIITPTGTVAILPDSATVVAGSIPAQIAGDGIMPLAFDDQGRLIAIPSPSFAQRVQMLAPPTVNTETLVSSSNVVIWSDSMAANGSGWGPNLAGLFTDRSVTIFGNGGQAAGEIAARQGGVDITISVSGGAIPASGGVAITAKNHNILSDGGGYNGTQTGTIHGASDVYGTMSTDASGNWTFTRAADGSAVTVADGSVFELDTQESYRAHTAVFVSGTNDMLTTAMADTDLQAVIDTNIAMVAHLLPRVKHFFVVGLTTGYEATGSNLTNMTRFNTLMRDAVGEVHFVDMADFMVNRAIYEAIDDGLLASGTYPTTDDLADISAGVVPRSMTVSGPHYNETGKAMAAKHIKRHIEAKGA